MLNFMEHSTDKFGSVFGFSVLKQKILIVTDPMLVPEVRLQHSACSKNGDWQ